jgi:hypothetical protein
VVTIAYPYILLHEPPFSPFLHLKKKRGRKRREREREREKKRKKAENTRISKVLPPLPP